MNNINIKQIIEKFPDCLTNGVKLKAILLDIYPEISKAIVSASVIIVNCGIAKEIRDSKNITALDKSRWQQKLEDDYGLSAKVIKTCLNLFLYNSTVSQRSSSDSKSQTKGTTTPRIFINGDVKVGSKIKLGAYWQGRSQSAGKTPIKWRVLAKDGNKALVISEKVLDCESYDKSYNKEILTTATWETCSLREWLNGSFLNEAFSKAEQSQIKNTNVSADKNPRYGTSAGNATIDKIFLLSIDEVNKYFTNNEARKCAPTAYAKVNGAYTRGGTAVTWWWLRSPGESQYGAAGVGDDGLISYGGGINFFGSGCVRPAMWVDLSTAEEKKENLKKERREKGFCQYCGGEFKGLLIKKCSICGKRKDY